MQSRFNRRQPAWPRAMRFLAAALTLLCAASPALAQKSPEEELADLKAAPGMEVSLFASEPMVINPAAIDVDTKGRVWVAEIQYYRAAAKNPAADQIKVLEDTDHDGHADKVTVFAEGVFCPMSICVAGDKVFVATSPDLWMYEDKNGDLKADGPPQKVLTGFGGQNHDHGAHSLVLGPDHKWWMSHGDTGFDVTGPDGSHVQYSYGAMLRGELDGSHLEMVAHNFRNPYEICVSSFGESYCSDNDNDGNFSVRICWILDGGNYGWFGQPPFAKEELDTRVPPGTPFREHWHFRGYEPGYVPAVLVTGFGSPCGICFYEGDAFGPDYKNLALHCDAGPREVRAYRFSDSGFGKQATSEVVLTSATDGYFRPDDVCTAPDGSLLIADWYDGGVGGHAYNNPTQGRIFLVRPVGKKLERVGKAGPFNTLADALVALANPNLATQFLARERLLAEPEASVPALVKLLSHDDLNLRARALWLLDRMGGSAREVVVGQLRAKEPAMAALAVRILRRHGEEFKTVIRSLADHEDGQVRREVALSLAGASDAESLQTLVQLAVAADLNDRYALETIHAAAGENAKPLFAAFAEAGKLSPEYLPLLQLLDSEAAEAYIAKLLADGGLSDTERQTIVQSLGRASSEEAGKFIANLIAADETPTDLRRLALGMLSANLQAGWKSLQTDEKLIAGLRKLVVHPDFQTQVLRMIDTQGLPALLPDCVQLAQDSSVSVNARVAALRIATEQQAPGISKLAQDLVADASPEVQSQAVSSLVLIQDWGFLKQQFTNDKLPPDLASAVVEKMVSSNAGALVLLRWLDDKVLPQALADNAIGAATAHPDINIRVLYERYIPEDKRPQRLGAAVKPQAILALTGDPNRGENIFTKSSAAQCNKCHRVNNVGGALGPDLSQIGRKYAKDALLETILQPSKAIAPEFETYLAETTSGQVYLGFLVEKTAQRVVLKDAENRLLRIAAADIGQLVKHDKSLMPELVLQEISAQDAADLLAYLTTLKSAVQPVTQFRVLGPFVSETDAGLDTDYGPESKIDLAGDVPQLPMDGFKWELVEATSQGDYLGIDSVRLCASRGLATEKTTIYYYLRLTSPTNQDATLLLGTDDSCKVFANGKQLHQYVGRRALGYAQDRVTVPLDKGDNTILIKVVNHGGPGGISLAVGSSAPVQVRTE